MLRGPLRRQGYDWWWHSLTAKSDETGEEHCQLHRFFAWKDVEIHMDATHVGCEYGEYDEG